MKYIFLMKPGNEWFYRHRQGSQIFITTDKAQAARATEEEADAWHKALGVRKYSKIAVEE